MPQFVAFIVACKGIPFYGFHVGYKTFLKIYVVDPKHSKRVADVLRSGSLMGNTAFEVFEDHVNFTLQFMLDQNLFGCGWVEVSDCLFRGPLPGASRAGGRCCRDRGADFRKNEKQTTLQQQKTTSTNRRVPERSLLASTIP